MKTPKRNHKTVTPYRSADYRKYRTHVELGRWKRKNRVRQLKHTIALLNRKLDAVLRANEWLSKRYSFARKMVEKHCTTQLPENTLPCNVIFLELTTGKGSKMNWWLTTDHNATIDDCVDVCIAAENHLKTTKQP